MNNYENKYYKIEVNKEELFIKTGKTSENYSNLSSTLEILDFAGKIDLFQDKTYINDKLAYEIMKFIVRLSFKQTEESEILNFHATDERRALYRRLKVPLIIKETIV